MQLTTITDYAEELLHAERFHDYAPIGLQVEGDGRDIRRIALGVTANLELILKARDMNADAIFVHHGWFWKHEEPRVTSIRRMRLAELLKSGMALVSYHLPLDDHEVFGNNALLGQHFGFTATGRFGEDNLGWIGTTPTVRVDELAEKIEADLARKPLVVGPREKSINRVAWCSGAAQDYIEAACEAGADCFISGEISERTTHIANELGITYMSCGHHATERYGIQALGAELSRHFGLEAKYIEIENPV